MSADHAKSLIARTGWRSFLGRALELPRLAQMEFDRSSVVETLEEAAQIFGVCEAVSRRDRAIDTLGGNRRPL